VHAPAVIHARNFKESPIAPDSSIREENRDMRPLSGDFEVWMGAVLKVRGRNTLSICASVAESA
jgi:hypothetical protein